MKRNFSGFLLGAALCGAAASATAQSGPAGEVAPQGGPGAPKGATVPNTDVGNSSGSLSDKLNATNGVIHPQGTVDPAMEKPTPPIGTMPVIPPPGSPGGPPGVQPK